MMMMMMMKISWKTATWKNVGRDNKMSLGGRYKGRKKKIMRRI